MSRTRNEKNFLWAVRADFVVLGFKHVHRRFTSQAVNNTQPEAKNEQVARQHGQRDFNSSAGASYALIKLRDTVGKSAMK
jgi:hypothetical protein